MDIHLLYETQPQPQQEDALHWEKGMRRRVTLSTGIAEDSLFVSGVRTVVDSGLTCQPLFEAEYIGDAIHTVRMRKWSYPALP